MCDGNDVEVRVGGSGRLWRSGSRPRVTSTSIEPWPPLINPSSVVSLYQNPRWWLLTPILGSLECAPSKIDLGGDFLLKSRTDGTIEMSNKSPDNVMGCCVLLNRRDRRRG